MQRNLLIRLIICLSVVSTLFSKAQLSGTVTIPGTYPSLSAAIVDINTQGVNGPLTVLVSTSYTETVPTGGFSLTATGTAVNPILFQKNGLGANPVLVSYIGGTGTPASAVQDGIWRFIGSDYVTVDGIDLFDQNTSNPSTMEYGFGFFKANTTNACQNNTIQNCTINLKTINNVTGAGPSLEGSRGINLVNALATSQNGNISPLSSNGSNSFNHFYRNVITNCNVGIALIGYVAASPFTLADSGNEIGGLLAANGNTIINFGGAAAATNPASGIKTLAQYNLLIANNTFNNNDGSGANHINSLRAIFVNLAASAITTIINNTITLNGAATTFTVAGIENSAGTTAASNTITIQGNVLANCSHTTNTTGVFYGIYNNLASGAGLIVSDNKFNTIATAATSGNVYLIYNNAAIAGAATYTNNQFTNLSHTVTSSGAYYGIWNNAALASDLSLSSNTFSNCNVLHNTGAVNPIYNTGASASVIQMNGNAISSFSCTSNNSGTLALIYNNAASASSLSIVSNSISSSVLNNNSGAYHLIYNRGALTNTFNVLAMNNNSVSTVSYSSSAAGAFYTVWNNGVTSTLCSVANNTVTNNSWLTLTNTRYVIANWGVSAVANLTANLITSSSGTIGTSGPIFFIYNNNPNAVSSGSLSISNNTLTGLSFSTSTADQSYIQNAGVSTNTFSSVQMNGNVLTAISSTIGGSGGHYGLYNNTASANDLSMLSNTVSTISFFGTNGPLYHFYNRGQASSFFAATTMSLNSVRSNTYSASSTANFQLILNAGVASSNFSVVQIAANTISNCVQTSGAANLIGILNSAIITGTISIINNLFTQFTATANLTGVITGIQNTGQISSSLSISNNTISSNNTSASTGTRNHIYNTGIGTGTINLSNNLITGATHSVSSSASLFHVINGSGTGGALVVNNNTITASTSTLLNGSTYLVYNSSATTNTIADVKMDANSFTSYSATSTSGSFFGLYNNLITSSLVSISSNTLSNCVITSTSSSKFLVVNSALVSGSLTIASNSLSAVNLSSNSTGNIFCIYNTSSVTNVGINSNTLTNIPLATNNTSVFVINNVGAVPGTLNIINNRLSLLTYSASTGGYFSAIQNGAVTGGTANLSGNSFITSTLSTNTGVMNFICNRGAASATLNALNINSNRIDGIAHSSTTGSVSAIFNTGITTSITSISNNTITNVAISGTATPRILIFNTSTTSVLANINANYLGTQSYTIGQSLSNAVILNAGPSNGTISIASNTIAGLNITSTNASVNLLQNTGAANDFLSIQNNLLTQGAYTQTGTAGFNGIINSSATGSVITINGNAISTSTISVPTATLNLINCSRTSTLVSSLVSISNNTINNNSLQVSSGFLAAIYSNSVQSQNTFINSNSFLANTLASATGSVFQILHNSATSQSLTLSTNLFSSNSFSSTGSMLNQCIANWANAGDLTMNSNTFIANSTNGTQMAQRLFYNAGSLSLNGTMSQNVITLNNHTSAGSGSYKYIENVGPISGSLSVNGNEFSSNQNAVFSGNLTMIHNGAPCIAGVQISNNDLSQEFSTTSNGYSGLLTGILNDSFVQTGTLSITQNTFSNFVFNSGATGDLNYISNFDNPLQVTITNNIWSALSLNHSGQQQLIYNEASQNSLAVVGNSITGGYVRTSSAGNIYLYVAGTNITQNTNEYIANNSFSNISATVAGSGSFYGINSQNVAASKTITANQIGNINYNASGFMFLIKADGLGTGASTLASVVNSNSINAVLWQGPFYGLDIVSNSGSTLSADVFDNAVTSVTAVAGTPGMYGIHLSNSGAGLNAYRNTIGDLKEQSGQGTVNGILVDNNSTTRIFNNVIGDLAAPNSQIAEGANGLKINGTGLAQVSYNTVLLYGSYTGTNSGSNALYVATTCSLDLQNNILINRMPSSGSGLAVAFRRSASGLNLFLSSSDRNLLYAGIPNASNVLYANGASNYTTLPAYMTHVSPRDANSISENINFLSVNPTNIQFLRIDPSINTAAESGAINILGITNDIDVQVRQGNVGYAGTGTNPDIGADEFNQSLVPCSTASAGTIGSATGSVQCEGNSVYLFSTGFSTDGNINYQWKVSAAAGGPYTAVTSAFGSNKPSLNTNTLNAGTYYFVFEVQCSNGPTLSTSNEYTLQINALPGASASINPAQVCAGGLVTLNASSSNGASFIWQGPGSYSATNQSPQIQNVASSSSGVYTVTGTLLGCSSTATATLIVSIQPPNFSISPLSSSICAGVSQSLIASIPITNPLLTNGNQSSQNGAASYPAPYSAYYGGQKMQFIILAAELSGNGFTTGSPITGIRFPVVSLGGGWGSVIQSCQNFQLSIKASTLSTLTQFQSGLVTVVPSNNYTPIVGYGNTHTFNIPFVWDGQSNLIVETVFSNNMIGNGSTSVIQYNTNSGFQSTLVYRADNQSFSAMAAVTNSNLNVGLLRPDFILTGLPVGTYSWSPSQFLSSSTGSATIASPTISSVFIATLSNGVCESTSSISIHVDLTPTVAIIATSNSVCIGNSATLTASGANSYTWNNGSNSTSIVINPQVTSSYALIGKNGVCPNNSVTTQISVLPPLSLTIAANPAIICEGETSSLTAVGAANYTWIAMTVGSQVTVNPIASANYTVFATLGTGCSATKTVNVKVNPLPEVLVSATADTICSGVQVNFFASGAFTYTWLPSGQVGGQLTDNPLVTTIYTLTGRDLNLCSNTATIAVDVNACDGISENVGSGLFSVFPNPASDVLHIRFSNGENRRVRLCSLDGKLVYLQDNADFDTVISVKDFAAGLYILTITDQKGSNNLKITVQ